MDFIVFLLHFIMWVAIFLVSLCAALVLSCIIAMFVGGIKWIKAENRRLRSLKAYRMRSDAEEDELPFSDYEEQE